MHHSLAVISIGAVRENCQVHQRLHGHRALLGQQLCPVALACFLLLLLLLMLGRDARAPDDGNGLVKVPHRHACVVQLQVAHKHTHKGT